MIGPNLNKLIEILFLFADLGNELEGDNLPRTLDSALSQQSNKEE